MPQSRGWRKCAGAGVTDDREHAAVDGGGRAVVEPPRELNPAQDFGPQTAELVAPYFPTAYRRRWLLRIPFAARAQMMANRDVPKELADRIAELWTQWRGGAAQA